MRPLRFLALTALVLAGSTACATMNVASHIQPDIDFTRYHTWDWGQADALPTGDPRLDNNEFFNDYLQGAVERGMARGGYAQAARGGTPDLRVHYHANVNQRFQVNEPTDCATGNCQANVIEYEQGTLVIDVLDTKTNRVVWRGWAQDSMQGIIDNQDRLERQVDEAVRKMFARFPSTQ